MNSGQNRKGKPHQGFPIPGPGVPRKDGSPPMQCSDDLIARLAPEIERTSIRGACQRLSVLHDTFKRWRQRGERDRAEETDSVFARLSVAVDRAIGERELRLVEGAQNGTVPERVAMFMLERLHPQDFQQRQAIEVETRMESTDVRARIEARLIRDLDATTIDGSGPAVDASDDPLLLPAKTEP